MPDVLPDKFTPIARTIVGESALLLNVLGGGQASVGTLFTSYKSARPTATFDRFATCVTFLYAAGVIDMTDQTVRMVD